MSDLLSGECGVVFELLPGSDEQRGGRCPAAQWRSTGAALGEEAEEDDRSRLGQGLIAVPALR